MIYAGTFASGAVALVFQVVWQRYLAFLVGSEARLISLIVAVFLLGLASGYRFWGNVTRRRWSRAALLKAVGFVELGIAAYGLLFPRYFELIRGLAWSGPDWLVLDLLATAALLGVPTFLMGASIPVLTAAVPRDPEEVNYCHSRIYGINTLGAFLGALIAGLYLVPVYGLVATLILGSVLEAIVGLVFVLNPLRGESHKARDIPRIPNRFGAPGIYGYVFTVGAVSIGLEVLLTRAVTLAVGSTQYVFPIVVGVVILGLAIGSLSLRRAGLPAGRVPRELVKVAVILAVVYFTVPYWPLWISDIRVSLAVIPSNYGVYLFLVVLFVSIMVLPLMIPMGRLLPLGYALIDKTGDDCGRMCGRVYFCNTLGAVVGAVGIGYLLFLVLNLPRIFEVCIALLLVLAAALYARSARRTAAAACLAGAVLAFALPGWNRIAHVIALYRYPTVQDFNFQGLLHLPPPHPSQKIRMLRDDPVATIAAYSADEPDVPGSPTALSIQVNGKSDGNTIGDYSTVVLLGMLPYLYAPRAEGLRAAVVGLGTGMTSGVLASAPDVASVTTLEISPGVIEAGPFFADASFDLPASRKSRIVQADVFRFFARCGEKFDIIASEPSNPWVVGVENLFTPEFYALAGARLAPGGVLCQWIQMYSTTGEIFGAICANVCGRFDHTALFIIGEGDVAILASHEPLSAPNLRRRLEQPAVQAALAPMAIDDPALLSLLEAWDGPRVAEVARSAAGPAHSVEFPWIAHAAARALFLDRRYRLDAPVLADFGRHLGASPDRSRDFEQWMAAHAADLGHWCDPTPGRHGTGFVCTRLKQLATDYRRVRDPPAGADLTLKLESYGRLRQQGLLAADLDLLDASLAALISGPTAVPDAASAGRTLLRQLALEWEWQRADAALNELAAAGVLSPQQAQAIGAQIDEYRRSAETWSAARHGG